MQKIIYWIATALLTLLYLFSATFYATQGDTVRHMLGQLGYPGYLVPLLLTVKIAGVLAVLSRVSVGLSDLAYAGMFYHLALAFSAHLNAHDPAGGVPALVGLCAVIASFLTQNAARAKPSPYGLSPRTGHG